MSAVLPSHSFTEDDATRREANNVPQYLWNQALNIPAEQFMTRFGKQIRSTLIREAFIAAGGEGDTPRAIAESIELLHAGSLIIDDIEDDSAERRGEPTLHRQIGLPLALNTGNWMYFRALEKLSELETDNRTKYRMISQTVRIVRRCHEGQALDLSAAVNLIARAGRASHRSHDQPFKNGRANRTVSLVGCVHCIRLYRNTKSTYPIWNECRCMLADAERPERVKAIRRRRAKI